MKINYINKYIPIILFIIISLNNTVKASNKLISVSFGDVTIGRSLININLKDFKFIFVNTETKTEQKIKLSFPTQKVQWIRDENNFLVPRARVNIEFLDSKNSYSIHYGSNTIIPQYSTDLSTQYTQLYINLFNPSYIKIYQLNKIFATFTISKKQTKIAHKNKVDLTCAPYHLQINGFKNDYLSVSCKMHQFLYKGRIRPRLEVIWSATSYRLADDSKPPYKLYLHSSSPSKFIVKNPQGQIKEITVQAHLPRVIHKVKTAFGFGPYLFKSKDTTTSHNNLSYNKDSNNYQLAPSLMLYGKVNLTAGTSIRMFNALTINKSIFNNLGVYFAYEMADAFDGLIELIPLLGSQVLTFKYQGQKTTTELIYPQGFEAVYRHAFDIPNFIIIAGMFFSTSDKVQYKNFWLRWGKKYFWELNYIEWGNNIGYSSMYGLSIGIPLISFW